MKLNSTAKFPCIHIKAGGDCLEGLWPGVYEAALVHSQSNGHKSHHHIDQSTSAIVYVSIVVIFYVIIIMVLVGTTLKRRGLLFNDEPEETKHLLLYDERTHTVHQSNAVSTSKIQEAGLITV